MYYLKADNKIVELDTTDFLEINMFTGNFINQNELVDYLLKENLIDVRPKKVEIVKLVGNKKSGHKQASVNEKIIYKSARVYLDINKIKEFLINNKDIMLKIIKIYLNEINLSLNKILNKEKEYMQRSLFNTEEELNAQDKAYINRLKSYQKNLVTLSLLIKNNQTDTKEYGYAVSIFINNFTLSGKGINKRGLVKMANIINDLEHVYYYQESVNIQAKDFDYEVDDFMLKEDEDFLNSDDALYINDLKRSFTGKNGK